MTKIYTKTGDKGDTGLWGGPRVPKNHPRVTAYGEVDELNSVLGLAIAALPKTKPFKSLSASLDSIQEELFSVGAFLASPKDDGRRLSPRSLTRLENEIDAMTSDLKPLRRFILPGGGPCGACFHLARTVCRRAERAAVALSNSETVRAGIIVYLNRLSDWLFTAARWVNARQRRPERTWEGLEKK